MYEDPIWTNRTHRLVFVGPSGKKPAYSWREMLKKDAESRPVPDDLLIKVGHSTADAKELVALLLQSLMVLILPGETPTTEFIASCFESDSIILALSHEQEALLKALPFHPAVPWHKIILWVDSDEFKAGPVEALLEAIDGITDEEATKRLVLMRKHKREVTWSTKTSRASHNILQAALLKVTTLPAA